jgi:hypothetical protein
VTDCPHICCQEVTPHGHPSAPADCTWCDLVRSGGGRLVSTIVGETAEPGAMGLVEVTCVFCGKVGLVPTSLVEAFAQTRPAADTPMGVVCPRCRETLDEYERLSDET